MAWKGWFYQHKMNMRRIKWVQKKGTNILICDAFKAEKILLINIVKKMLEVRSYFGNTSKIICMIYIWNLTCCKIENGSKSIWQNFSIWSHVYVQNQNSTKVINKFESPKIACRWFLEISIASQFEYCPHLPQM